MARYFFHLVTDDEIFPDDEGRTLTDAGTAVDVAVREARAIISADALDGRIDLAQAIRVTDATGATLGCVRFVDAIEVVMPTD